MDVSIIFRMMQVAMGQADGAGAPAAEIAPGSDDGAMETVTGLSDAATVQSVFDYIDKGGVMMIPIGICSLVMLAVAIERLISLRRNRIIPPGFMSGLQKELGQTTLDAERGLAYCERQKSPIASICTAGLKKLGRAPEVIERTVQDAGEWEVFKLRKNVRVLSVIAAIAPLMGLVGTIFGMIKAFQTVATSAESLGKTELLAEGIYEAMVTTAAGLLVAIPAVIFYHWISAKIEKLVAEMDRVCIALLEDSLVGAPIAVPRLVQADSNKATNEKNAPKAAVAS